MTGLLGSDPVFFTADVSILVFGTLMWINGRAVLRAEKDCLAPNQMPGVAGFALLLAGCCRYLFFQKRQR